MKEKSKYNQLKSIGHKILDESLITRYFFQDLNVNDIEEIMRKDVSISNKKNERYLVSCGLKLLTTTIRVRYIKINTKPNLDYFLTFSKSSILSRINQD